MRTPRRGNNREVLKSRLSKEESAVKQQNITAVICSKSVQITLVTIWLLGSTLFVFSATKAAGKDTNMAGPNSVHNDDFDFADVFPEPPANGLANQILQDTTDATVAPDDPDMGCGAGVNSNAVWFKITPSYRGRLRVRTYSILSPDDNSNYDTVVAVFTGRRGDLQRIVCNDDAPGHEPLSELTFETEAGKVYYVEVAGYGTDSSGGTLSLFMNYDSVETQAYCGQWRWINCGVDTWPAFFPVGSSQPWIPLVPVPGYPFPDPIGQYWRVWDPQFGGVFGSCPPYQDPIWVTDLSNHEVVSGCEVSFEVYLPLVLVP